MKTAISVPDDTFKRATRKAASLGMSRSEFFAVAALRYLDELERTSLTEQINEVVDRVSLEESGAIAAAVGIERLRDGDDW